MGAIADRSGIRRAAVWAGMATVLLTGALFSAPKPVRVQEFRGRSMRATASRIKVFYGQNPRRILLIGQARLEAQEATLTARRLELQVDTETRNLVGAKATDKVHLEMKQSEDEEILADCSEASLDAKGQKLLLTGGVKVLLRDRRLEEPGTLTGETAILDLREKTVDVEGGASGPTEIWLTPKQSQ